MRGRRPIPFVGPMPALLILATWMCTYHFMYYDSLISAFGVCVLLADPRPFFKPRTIDGDEHNYSNFAAQPDGFRVRSAWLINSFVLTVIFIMLFNESITRNLSIEVTAIPYSITTPRTIYGGATEVSPRIEAGTNDRYAIETFLVMAIWAWCGLTVLVGKFGRSEDSEGVHPD